ncbi:MAG: hypothetical protein A1D16_19875 [Flavihumibacter sp. CACIAM 22H1]|nr:MAG: hypothetical protein A1D16_19875 [Flavihumibacter sp. CACIAM 22H1]
MYCFSNLEMVINQVYKAFLWIAIEALSKTVPKKLIGRNLQSSGGWKCRLHGNFRFFSQLSIIIAILKSKACP